jgi:hypothetical protein
MKHSGFSILQLFTLCAFFIYPARSWSQFLGPLQIRDARPYDSIFLQFYPENPRPLDKGKTSTEIQLDVANNLLIPAPSGHIQVTEDFETQRLQLFMRRGLGHGNEGELIVPLIWRDGGFMDGILSIWHHLFGIAADGEDIPAGRDFYTQYRSDLSLTDSAGREIIHQGNAFGLGDTTLQWKHALLVQNKQVYSLRCALKIPTGNAHLLLGSGAVDMGLFMDGSWQLGRDIHIILGGGGILTGAGSIPHREPTAAQGLLDIEYHPNSRDSYLWQIDAQGTPVRTYQPFADRAQVTATFGYKRKLFSKMILNLSFSENGDIHNYTLPFISNIGPDFSIASGIEIH